MPSAIDEVIRQHVFIEAWLDGRSTDPDEWQLFGDVLDDDFVIVPPGGIAEPKAALLPRFHAAAGAMPGVRVEIRNGRVLRAAGGLAVVRYEEWQIHEVRGNQRVSTAVFEADDTMPLGWRWLTLHETALPA